jgi:glucose/arabinose dehydrogenase
MNARLVFACAATGIALTVFAAAPAAAATAGPIAVVAAEGQPTTTPAEPPVTGTPTEPPTEPAPGLPAEPPAMDSPTEPPADAPAPPQQVPVTPRGGADTGSLDPAPQQGSDAGVIALGGMALLAAGGLGVAAHRRRQRA